MIGTWRTRNGKIATVTHEVLLPLNGEGGSLVLFYLGTVDLPEYGMVKMLWNESGDSPTHDFDLVERKRDCDTKGWPTSQ